MNNEKVDYVIVEKEHGFDIYEKSQDVFGNPYWFPRTRVSNDLATASGTYYPIFKAIMDGRVRFE
jgi:hypothetical protein